MKLEDGNAEHAIPDQLSFIDGPGGLPLIRVRNSHAEALVSLCAGHCMVAQIATVAH